MFKRLFVLLSLLVPSLGYAQQSMTLEQCLEQARQNNILIVQARQSYMVTEQNVRQYRWANYPTLNFTTNANLNGGRTIDPFTNVYTNQYIKSNNMSLGGSWLIFNGMSNRRTIQQYEAELEAAEANVKLVEQQVALQVTQQYLDLLFLFEKIKMQRSQLEATTAQTERTAKMLASGAVAESALLDMQAQQALEEALIIDSENQMQLGLLNLANLMNLPNPEGLSIVQPAPFEVPENMPYASPAEILDSAALTQPGLAWAEHKSQSAQYAVQATRGKLYPRLSLNYSLSSLYTTSAKVITDRPYVGETPIGYTHAGDTVYTPVYRSITTNKEYFKQIKDNFSQYIGLSLTVPILNGMQNRTALQRAIINTRIAETNYAQQKNQLRYDVYTAYASAQGSLRKYKAYQKSVLAQRESFRSAERRYENGTINSLELTQAKVRLMQSESDLLQAKYNYVFKLKVLELYLGRGIKL